MSEAMNPACERVFPVFLEFEQELRRYITRKVQDVSVAEDLTQGLALKLHDHCDKLTEVRNMRAWLYRLAHYAVADYWRERQKVQQAMAVLPMEEQGEDEVKLLVEDCLMKLLPQLPPEYREAVYQADVLGIPQKELAEQWGIHYSTLKMRVQRGRQKLKALFTGCCHAVVACDMGAENC